MSYCFYCVYIHIYVSFTLVFSFLLSLVRYVWCWGNPKGRKVIRLHHFNVHISTSNPPKLFQPVSTCYTFSACFTAIMPCFYFFIQYFFIYLQFELSSGASQPDHFTQVCLYNRSDSNYLESWIWLIKCKKRKKLCPQITCFLRQ